MNEYVKKAIKYMNDYKSRIEIDIQNTNNKGEKEYLKMITNDIDNVLYHICVHEWEMDEYEVNNEIVKVNVCSICNCQKE